MTNCGTSAQLSSHKHENRDENRRVRMFHQHPRHLGAVEHYCNTLQHAATRCNMLRVDTTTTHCNTLQHAATRCNTLRHAATHCNTPEVTYSINQHPWHLGAVECYRNTLQHTATHCNTPQHAATRCDMLQHTATHLRWTIVLINIHGTSAQLSAIACIHGWYIREACQKKPTKHAKRDHEHKPKETYIEKNRPM